MNAPSMTTMCQIMLISLRLRAALTDADQADLLPFSLHLCTYRRSAFAYVLDHTPNSPGHCMREALASILSIEANAESYHGQRGL
jgi:hypothetical protein